MEIDSLEQLIIYCNFNDRICPQPLLWNKLWNLLNDKKQVGNSWEPPVPLILGAWNYASSQLKQSRFIQHLIWANAHGQLDEIAEFITSLKEEQWFHLGDINVGTYEK